MSNPIITDIATVAAEVEKADAQAIAALSHHKGPTIAVWNQSTVLTDEQIIPVVAALQIQASRDFAKAWGLDATLVFVPKANTPGAGWQLVVLDDSTQAGALGFHDVTVDGLPIGKVFAKTDLTAGSSWSVTMSHELLEMLGDPGINLTAFSENQNGGGRLYAYEVGDAPEADENGYLINGVLVSDFVFPSWFEPFWAPNSTQFDYQKKITAPFQLLPGGYIGYYDVASGNGWQQLTADKNPNTLRQSRGAVGSRRDRRRTPRDQWTKSTK
jgi:hypothetical protein